MKYAGVTPWRMAYNMALFVGFVVAYLAIDIFAATIVVMAGVMGEIALTLALRQKVSKLQWIGLLIVLVLGSATLLVRDDTFIKLRPTAVYWLIAAAFLIAFLMRRNPIELIVGRWFDAPTEVWVRLARSWVVILFVIGAVNLPVAFLVSTDLWILWRVFGAPGLIAVLVAAQVVRYRHFLTRSPVRTPMP